MSPFVTTRGGRAHPPPSLRGSEDRPPCGSRVSIQSPFMAERGRHLFARPCACARQAHGRDARAVVRAHVLHLSELGVAQAGAAPGQPPQHEAALARAPQAPPHAAGRPRRLDLVRSSRRRVVVVVVVVGPALHTSHIRMRPFPLSGRWDLISIPQQDRERQARRTLRFHARPACDVMVALVSRS